MQNINVDRIVFENVQDVDNFFSQNYTDQASGISNILKQYIKVIDTTTKQVCYFDNKIKLWVNCSFQDYNSFFYKFFTNTEAEIKKLNIDNVYKKIIDKICKDINKKSYILDVSERMLGDLKDIEIVEKLNKNVNYLPIKNGKKICFKTLEITDRTPDDYFTYESPVNYLDKELKNANKFFSQIMPTEINREYMRKILGYSLTGRTDARNFFIWYGSGSNGKSLISNFMNKILGEQYTQCNESIFIKSTKTAGAATPEIMALVGKRCGFYSEGESGDKIEMALSRIKQISGEDTIEGRGLYKGFTKFKLDIKLHMLTNYTPPLDAQEAVKERLKYIFLDSRFVENPKEKNEFKKDSNYINQLETIYFDEIFSWIIRGAQDFYDNPEIVVPREFQERTTKILLSADSIKTFIDRNIVLTNNILNDRIGKKELFESYNNFCVNNSQRCFPRTSLFTRLEQMNISTGPHCGYDCFKGIKFKDEDIDDEEEEDEDENTKILRQIKDLKVLLKNKEMDESLKKDLKSLRKTIKNVLKD